MQGDGYCILKKNRYTTHIREVIRMTDFLSLLGARKSFRQYSGEPMKKHETERLLEAALLAPSSRDIKPWELIVVDNPALLARLADAKAHGASFLKDAAIGIAVLGNPELSDVWVEDTAIVSILLQLAATDSGLGSCWIQIRNRKDKAGTSSGEVIRKTLDIPQPWEVESIIAVGRLRADDDKIPASAPERDFSSLMGKIHRNKY